MLASMASNVVYSTAVKVAAILAILAMAVQNNLEAQYANDSWYAGMIAVIVIGPHALDRLSGDGTRDGTASKAARALVPFVPLLGLFAALIRYAIVP